MKVNTFTINSKIGKNILKRIADFLKKEFQNLKGVKELNIIVVDSKYIKELNQKFLGRDKETSVLSFDIDGIWEIYVNYDYAKNLEEFVYFIFHGFLHLIGHEHFNEEQHKQMESRAEELLNKWKSFYS